MLLVLTCESIQNIKMFHEVSYHTHYFNFDFLHIIGYMT